MQHSHCKKTSGHGFRTLLVYDTGICTKEEHDPAKAILYYRPRTTSIDAIVGFSGQLVGAAQFCSSVFSSPSVFKTKKGVVAVRRYDRFLVLMSGETKGWVEPRLSRLMQLMDAATGGISALWDQSNLEHSIFIPRLNSHLDCIISIGLPDVNFNDDILCFKASPSISASSEVSPASEINEKSDMKKLSPIDKLKEITKPFTSKKELRKIQFKNETDELEKPGVTESNMENDAFVSLMYEMESSPSVPLSKSGACAFLKTQQLLEMCQQHDGVFGGAVFFQDRIVTSQASTGVNLILRTLISGAAIKEETFLLERKVEFPLPADVMLSDINLSSIDSQMLVRNATKIVLKQKRNQDCGKKALGNNIPSLHSAIHNQLSQNHLTQTSECADESDKLEIPTKKTINQLSLCAKINHNSDLLSSEKPSRSLPGTPRKIRVSTMLPDVGSNSPDLRYKVLMSKRSKPGVSSNNTPRRFFMQNGSILKGILNPTSLKRKGFINSIDQIKSNSESKFWQDDKENIVSNNQQEFNDLSRSNVHVKNARNKLKLKFAPDKINRPQEDSGDEEKIAWEINGNDKKNSQTELDCILKNKLILFQDEDDTSKSEDSDISILDLGSFLESKENGNKLFAEATRRDSLISDSSDTNDSGVCEEISKERENQLTSPTTSKSSSNMSSKMVLYCQKQSQMSLFLFLDDVIVADQSTVYDLYNTLSSTLPEIESSLLKVFEMTEECAGDIFLRKTSSGLDTPDVTNLKLPLVIEAHRSFLTNRNLEEITLRESDVVLWGHKQHQSETFYQCSGIVRPGLPIPSDTMARISHRAKRRLEKDHGITIF